MQLTITEDLILIIFIHGKLFTSQYFLRQLFKMVPNKFLMKKETAKNHFKYALTTDPSASVRNGYFIANESTTME